MPFARAWSCLDGRWKKKLFRILLRLENWRSRVYDAKQGAETADEAQLGEFAHGLHAVASATCRIYRSAARVRPLARPLRQR